MIEVRLQSSNFMNFLKKINPEWPLRLGFGLMYLYSSYDIFYNTEIWKSYVPLWFFHLITPIMPLGLYLKMQSVGEFVMALLFLAWFSGRRGLQIASALASIEMAGILLSSKLDNIIFRDLGLLGAAIALLIISFGTGRVTDSTSSSPTP